mmetsp:Transcript_16308/g.46839  ORF Transcript_16308/g.46839 Transcript_16308/m.46839 type:complete len:242 (-) Transcript_16308:1220-1945(-)
MRDEGGEYPEAFWDTDFAVDGTVVSLAVPFASVFPSLKEMRFGLFDSIDGWSYVDGWSHGWNDVEDLKGENRSLMRALELSFSGAYDSGLVPPDAKILGSSIRCLENTEGITGKGCAFCTRYVECFPPEVMLLQGVRRCVPTKDMLRIIAKRSGGKQILESKEFLFTLFRNHDFCSSFASVVKEIGIVPATVSRKEVLQWLSKRSDSEIRYCFEFADPLRLHTTHLASLGVPIKLADVRRP